jgi:tRNA(Arg) A34 adenosine deaminase TadA
MTYMVPVPENITPTLVRRLELAADSAFDWLIDDIMQVKNGVYDYPVGSFALDRTGIMRLGKGVSTDIRTSNPEAHAEFNALNEASTSSFEAGIIVTTLESCIMCQTNATHRIGHSGLIAFVTSRTLSEELEHVNTRLSTTDESIDGIPSLQLMHPRLQAKGEILLGEHTFRDRATGTTNIVNRTGLQYKFSKIDERYPLVALI